MSKKLNIEALILENRTAFALYLKKGLEEVKRLYPASFSFVQGHQNKTLEEVTVLLTQKLNAQTQGKTLKPLALR